MSTVALPDQQTVFHLPKQQERPETPLESIRRFGTYQQLLESFQFVNSHRKMAGVLFLSGVAFQLPCIIYYSCYYISYMANIYCTVIPALYTLFNFKGIDMKHFKPPWHYFLFCSLNVVASFLNLVCTVTCFYLMLPIKGRYLATVRKQLERRKRYCVFFIVLLTVSIPYNLILSMLRNIRFLRGEIEENHQALISTEVSRSLMLSQGTSSFWSLHAYQNLPCCFSDFSSSEEAKVLPPAECCQSFGRNEAATLFCTMSTDRSLLWPDCSSAIANITGDIEVTMDAQMQMNLLLTCVSMVIAKYVLQPHLNMLCVRCQHTYGWLGMKRHDN
uniref:G_PROTEIN_RECEP_F1_2 domain-containing protein n=1 Tax=Macrostomum lignano TaxID=282301 RepID=A0A1I8HH99_9PLAT